LEPLLRNQDTIKLEWSHQGTGQYFDVSSLSDGTLRFIALATLFLQPKRFRPSAILVAEPELGLHPYAIGLLASLIRQASVDTQVVVSSQSSLLLDHFSPEDVLVADRVEGHTEIKRLSPATREEWLEDCSLGQLWKKTRLAEGQRAVEHVARLLIHIEGPTEEDFVNEVLGDSLRNHGFVSVSARIVGNARRRDRRGGIRPWAMALKDIVRHLSQDPECLASTMVDFYALPLDWPGRAEAARASTAVEKGRVVEQALHADLCEVMGHRFNGQRFIPFLAMHEFEALLFSDCAAFSAGIGESRLN